MATTATSCMPVNVVCVHTCEWCERNGLQQSKREDSRSRDSRKLKRRVEAGQGSAEMRICDWVPIRLTLEEGPAMYQLMSGTYLGSTLGAYRPQACTATPRLNTCQDSTHSAGTPAGRPPSALTLPTVPLLSAPFYLMF